MDSESQLSDQARWFQTEIQPHASALRAWLQSRFPTHEDIDDIVQEAFVRVCQAWEKGEVQSPKAFLFTTARNLALDHIRHRRVERTDSLTEVDASSVMDMGAEVSEIVARKQELEILTQAIQSLPKRCRQVITLRKIYGLSQKEVATELGISEHTVEAQGTIGLRKLGDFFVRYDQRQAPRHE